MLFEREVVGDVNRRNQEAQLRSKLLPERAHLAQELSTLLAVDERHETKPDFQHEFVQLEDGVESIGQLARLALLPLAAPGSAAACPLAAVSGLVRRARTNNSIDMMAKETLGSPGTRASPAITPPAIHSGRPLPNNCWPTSMPKCSPKKRASAQWRRPPKPAAMESWSPVHRRR